VTVSNFVFGTTKPRNELSGVCAIYRQYQERSQLFILSEIGVILHVFSLHVKANNVDNKFTQLDFMQHLNCTE